MTQDQMTEGCQTKCLLASAGIAVFALILLMALFDAAFLVSLLLAVIVFFALAYVLPRQYCKQTIAGQPAATPKPAAPAKAPAAKPVVTDTATETKTAAPVAIIDPAPAKPAAKSVSKPAAEAATKAPAKPASKVKIDDASDAPGTQPATLSAARAGGPDDLKLIKGVGPKLETLLHEMGFYHFDQIAGWTTDELRCWPMAAKPSFQNAPPRAARTSKGSLRDAARPDRQAGPHRAARCTGYCRDGVALGSDDADRCKAGSE